ncbi:hypothetical protein M979_1805 [Buttiauxella noackiae ATCC 51607]|uniref:Uncharacterized protein n=2 Tax=Buttiauxella TaxID=82976 RepID=A0A3N5DIR6_9ENTR|nr:MULTISPECIES: hypothetical protein [Buttiauxella]OAT18981.1 hypothetical protein M979_1805 [Buttiauxella noackiae ATCC 51607]RPH25510.1 hypothetical protein EHN07_13145 [Buttiauxella warmboldiae]
MFENYLEHPDRHPKNAQLLAKYQPDIDKLSEIFTEDDLLYLMTQEQPDGTRKMRPSLASIEIFAPSALLSNYINFFQYTDYLEKWCKLQRKEFDVLTINIYGLNSIKQNRIPGNVLKEVDAFMEELLNKATDEPTNPILTLLNILDTLADEKTYQNNKPYIWNGKFSISIHNIALKIARRKIITYIKSSDFTNSLPKVSNLEPQDTALLFFARFCNGFYFHFLLQIIKRMKTHGLIEGNHLHHPAMMQLITLAMLPYEVIQHALDGKDHTITPTCPDKFVINETIPRNKENLTGIQKNINQTLYKTYIYIALLIFPEWKPTAKEIILFLEGKSLTVKKNGPTIKGLLDLKSTAFGLPSKINDVGRLSKEEYVTRLLLLAQTK